MVGNRKMRFLKTLAILGFCLMALPAFAQENVPTSGGLSIFSELVPNNTTSVAVKATFGQVYGIQVFNNSSTIAYLKLYNSTQANTTCGTSTPVARYMIPASSGFIYNEPNGFAFGTAISTCVTTGIADNDTSAPAASAYLVNITYK